MELTIRKTTKPEDEEFVKAQLIQYNLMAAPPVQSYISIPVNFVLESEEGNISGGLLGKLYRGCLFIDILWVSEDIRGLGYGAKLLQQAEWVAKNQGCNFVHLDTFSFQAPNFYEKQGYEIFGVLDSYSSGIKRYFLKKDL